MKKINYDLIIVTTCINDTYINNFLKSISISNNSIQLLIVVLVQNGYKIDVKAYETPYTSIQAMLKNEQYPLSKSRNIALQYIFDNKIKFDYITFPCDDTLYTNVFFDNFSKLITGNTIIDIYCCDSKDLYNPIKYKSGRIFDKQEYNIATSINMVIDRETAEKVGFFDENMGVGTYYGAGEDNDYFIRACELSGRGFRYEKGLWDYHPRGIAKYKEMTLSQLCDRYKKYGRGVIYLLHKHHMTGQALKICFNGLAGSLAALFQLRFKLSLARLCAFYVRSVTLVKLKLKSE